MKGPVLMGLVALALFAMPGQCNNDGTVSNVALNGKEDRGAPDEGCDIDVGRLLRYLLEDADHQEGARNNQDATTQPRMTPVTDESEVEKRNHLVDSFLTLLSDTIRQYQNPMKIYMKKSGVLVMRPAKRGMIGKRRKNKKRKRERKRNKGKREKRDISTKAPIETWENGGFGLSVIEDDENEDGEVLVDEYGDYIDEESSYYDEIDEEVGLENGAVTTSISKENNQDNQSGMEGSLGATPDLEEGRDLGGSSRQGKRKRNRKRKGGNGKCNKRCKRRRINRRRRRRKNRQQAARNGQQKRRTGPRAIASVSGMFNIRRSGDVRISKGDDEENIAADIEVGPIVLQAQKMAKTETAKSFKEAKAKTSVIKGTLVLKFDSAGIALKELNLIKPDVIQVTGSFAPKSGGTSGGFMRTYITKTQPLIVNKMKRAANRVLKLSQGNIAFFNSQGV